MSYVLTPAEPDDQGRPADDSHGAIIVATLVGCALAFSFHLTSFLHAKEAIVILGLIVLVTFDPLNTPLPRRGMRLFAPLWLGLLWCIVVHLLFGIAEVKSYTVEQLLRLSALLVLAAFAFEVQYNAQWRQRLLDALAVSTVLVAILALGQNFGILSSLFPTFDDYDQPMYSVFGNQDLLGGYLAAGVCLLVYNFLQKPQVERFMLAGLLVLVPALLLAGSRSAWLATAVGLVFVVLAPPFEPRRVLVLAIPAGALVFLLCIFAPERTIFRVTETFSEDDVGGRARLWFWDATVRMVADAPVLGQGLGNFQYFSPYYQGEALHAEGGERHYSNDVHTLHAHSDPLEILSETGIIGFALVVWMLLRLRRCRGPEWGPLAALLVFSLFNATYASAPHALAGLLLMGSLAARNALMGQAFVDEEPDKESARIAVPLGVVTWALAGLVVWTTLLPSYQLRTAERAIEASEEQAERAMSEEQAETRSSADAEQEHGRRKLRNAALARWPNYEAREAWAATLLEVGDLIAASDMFERAHEGLDTGRIWFFHGVTAEYLGNIEKARSLYRECLWRWPRDEAAWARLLPLLGPAGQAEMREEAERFLEPEAISRLF